MEEFGVVIVEVFMIGEKEDLVELGKEKWDRREKVLEDREKWRYLGKGDEEFLEDREGKYEIVMGLKLFGWNGD